MVLLSIAVSCRAWTQENSISENIQQVEQLFAKEKEALPADDVVQLANNILQKRHFYSADTTAKVFILLANTAINQGDLGKAMQFAQDGIAIVGINNVLKIDFLLKLTASHYFEGRFHQANEFANEAVVIARQLINVRYLLVALSYSAMSNALIANNLAAHQELQEIKTLLADNEQFNNYLEVIEILALAYLYQQDYDTAKALYNKAIKLRFESGKVASIDRSYYYLAETNLKLNRLDDAYSGFYQAKQEAIKHNLPIRQAFADLGLGKVLLAQNLPEEALQFLLPSKTKLSERSFGAPHMSALIALAKAYDKLENKPLSYEMLNKAASLSQKVEVSFEQLELYDLLADMYVSQSNYKKAIDVYKTQITHYEKHNVQQLFVSQGFTGNVLELQNREIALNVAEQSDVRQSYFAKYQQVKNIVFFLLALLVSVVIIAFYLYLNQRNQRLTNAYEDIEKPDYYIATPSQTKVLYQLNYKKARKFEYTLSVGYLSICNWEELTFRFNKRTVAEVAKTIATLINEYVAEFDTVGLISEGEYLFLSPHQNKQSLQKKLNLIANAINKRFFANLGDFSVKISYAFETPSIQDIDPYIFLSRLSESTRSEHTTFKK